MSSFHRNNGGVEGCGGKGDGDGGGRTGGGSDGKGGGGSGGPLGRGMAGGIGGCSSRLSTAGIAWARLATNCWLPPTTLASRRSSFLSTSRCPSLSNVTRPIQNGSMTKAHNQHAQPNARHSSEVDDDFSEASIGNAALPPLLRLRAAAGVIRDLFWKARCCCCRANAAVCIISSCECCDGGEGGAEGGCACCIRFGAFILTVLRLSGGRSDGWPAVVPHWPAIEEPQQGPATLAPAKIKQPRTVRHARGAYL